MPKLSLGPNSHHNHIDDITTPPEGRNHVPPHRVTTILDMDHNVVMLQRKEKTSSVYKSLYVSAKRSVIPIVLVSSLQFISTDEGLDMCHANSTLNVLIC